MTRAVRFRPCIDLHEGKVCAAGGTSAQQSLNPQPSLKQLITYLLTPVPKQGVSLQAVASFARRLRSRRSKSKHAALQNSNVTHNSKGPVN